MTCSEKEVLRGYATYWCETGTEGSWWAFQDERFVTPNTRYFICQKCYLSWDKLTETEEEVLEKGNRLGKKGCSHVFDLDRTVILTYEGLHILKDGDRLKIFSKEDPTKVEWEGVVALQKYPVFSEYASVGWIHSDQIGITRDRWSSWFFSENRAELIPA